MDQFASTVVAVAALVVSVITAVYVERQARQRELNQWRRTELLQAVGELMELSSRRQAELAREYDLRMNIGSIASSEKSGLALSATAMIVCVEKIKLIDDASGAAAQKLVDTHQAGINREILDPTPDIVESIGFLMVSPKDLDARHQELASAFRAAVELSHRRAFRRR